MQGLVELEKGSFEMVRSGSLETAPRSMHGFYDFLGKLALRFLLLVFD